MLGTVAAQTASGGDTAWTGTLNDILVESDAGSISCDLKNNDVSHAAYIDSPAGMPTIPAEATDIEFYAQCRLATPSGTVTAHMRILTGSTIDSANQVLLPTSNNDAFETLTVDPGDTWGITPVIADINAGFGAAVVITNSSGSNNKVSSLAWIKVGIRWCTGSEPPPPSEGEGQVLLTDSGTWTVPAGVTSICVVCVGGGGAGGATDFAVYGGGGGGGLAYVNDAAVTPGQQIAYRAGAGGVASGTTGGSGQSSYLTGICEAGGGAGGKSSGTASGGAPITGVGGNGGVGGAVSSSRCTGGGGAGGYTGNGGVGGDDNGGVTPTNGAGGGGGGGCGGRNSNATGGGGGGGVGVLGEGASGTATETRGKPGTGGSGGSSGEDVAGQNGTAGAGGNYGGGGGGDNNYEGDGTDAQGHGAPGAVRIIWGAGRSFPNNAGDV